MLRACAWSRFLAWSGGNGITDITQKSLFTFAKLDDFVPTHHPLCAIRTTLQRMRALLETL